MKKLNIILIVLFVILSTIVGGLIYFDKLYKDNMILNIDEEGYTIIVEEGESILSVIPTLEDDGIISNEFVTKIHVRMNDRYASINPGEYFFEKGTTLEELFVELTTKEKLAEFVVLQFLEGYTLEDFSYKLAEEFGDTSLQPQILAYWDGVEYVNYAMETFNIVDNSVLNNQIYHPLEGYIKPDTYHIDLESFNMENLKYITDVLIASRQEDFNAIIESGAAYNDYLKTPHEVITLASIVEREAKGYEARQMVAGIFINRLIAGDRLGSDVTTYYGIGVGLHERDLTMAELNEVNGYNTRAEFVGLPVGPINNPSRESINATFNYIPNDYYYFVSDKNGEMYYTKTYDEHINIVNELKANGLWYEYEE